MIDCPSVRQSFCCRTVPSPTSASAFAFVDSSSSWTILSSIFKCNSLHDFWVHWIFGFFILAIYTLAKLSPEQNEVNRCLQPRSNNLFLPLLHITHTRSHILCLSASFSIIHSTRWSCGTPSFILCIFFLLFINRLQLVFRYNNKIFPIQTVLYTFQVRICFLPLRPWQPFFFKIY